MKFTIQTFRATTKYSQYSLKTNECAATLDWKFMINCIERINVTIVSCWFCVAFVFSPSWSMEERTDSPIAVKVEGHSHSVILTYFQGDINSMVDAHFTRALSKGYKAKEPAAKTKKKRKIPRIGKQVNLASCQLATRICPIYSHRMIPFFTSCREHK